VTAVRTLGDGRFEVAIGDGGREAAYACVSPTTDGWMVGWAETFEGAPAWAFLALLRSVRKEVAARGGGLVRWSVFEGDMRLEDVSERFGAAVAAKVMEVQVEAAENGTR
jgi:hypothetical protein